MSFMTTTGATRFIRHGHACLGVAGPAGLTLTAGGHNDSPLWSRNPASGTGQLHTWSPWGNGNPTDGLPGFNGERPDPVSGSYHLGNGYRAYNPVLRRFNCPDSLSPFGAGGINPYAYCAGDPVNHTDPTGHISWQGILGIVAGSIGVLLTGGAALGAIAAAGSVAAAWSSVSATALVVGGLGIAADVTGIASGATEDVNPAASSVLGWVSMATGIAGMAAGAALAPKGVKAWRGREESPRISNASSTPSFTSYGSDASYVRGHYRATRPGVDTDAFLSGRKFPFFSSDSKFAKFQKFQQDPRTSPSRYDSPRNSFSSNSSWDNWSQTGSGFEGIRLEDLIHPNIRRSSISGYSNILQLDNEGIISRLNNYADNIDSVFPDGLTPSQFRNLARRIHPDKTNVPGSEDAIKSLNTWFHNNTYV